MAGKTEAVDQLMKALHDSEINCAISCFCEGIWEVKLGGERNGFKTVQVFLTLDEAAAWLWAETARLYPKSAFAGCFRP